MTLYYVASSWTPRQRFVPVHRLLRKAYVDVKRRAPHVIERALTRAIMTISREAGTIGRRDRRQSCPSVGGLAPTGATDYASPSVFTAQVGCPGDLCREFYRCGGSLARMASTNVNLARG